MNLMMLAAPAALRLGMAAAAGTTRHVADFAGHMADAIRGGDGELASEGIGGASTAEDPAEIAESDGLRSLKDFLRSIGADWQESIEWDHQAERIAKVRTDRLEPWQATSLRRWLDDRPHLKPAP